MNMGASSFYPFAFTIEPEYHYFSVTLGSVEYTVEEGKLHSKVLNPTGLDNDKDTCWSACVRHDGFKI